MSKSEIAELRSWGAGIADLLARGGRKLDAKRMINTVLRFEKVDEDLGEAVKALKRAEAALEMAGREAALLQAERDEARSERDQHQRRVNALAARLMLLAEQD